MRAFFIECSGRHWIAVARALSDRHGIAPILWTANRETVSEISKIFPGIVAQVGVDASCARFQQATSWPQAALDAPLLERLAADERIALAMMDRMNPRPGLFDHDARRRHWHELLRQWGAALVTLKPDVVIFSMAPHQIYDFVLYALCKVHGIPTRMFERGPVPGSVYVVSRFEEGCAQVLSALASQSGLPGLSKQGKQHIEAMRRGGEGALPPNYRKKLINRGMLRDKGRQSAATLADVVAFELRRAAYLLFLRRGPPENYCVYEDGDGRLVSPGVAGWIWNRWLSQYRKWCLRRFLARLVRPVDTERDYVLLALHFQPERAIVPMAGVYCDQNLIVDLLSRSIPEGWLLVVKEHPWQLVPFSRGELSRSTAFYRRIAELPNVVLAPPDLESQDLLVKARAVATATGSIGWQSLARRIPVLVFGAAWYRAASGVYPIDSRLSCEKAISAIQNGQRPPEHAAEQILAAVEAASVPGYLEPALEAVQGITEEEAADEMSSALARSLKQPFNEAVGERLVARLVP